VNVTICQFVMDRLDQWLGFDAASQLISDL
jgi:hypothetical protein